MYLRRPQAPELNSPTRPPRCISYQVAVTGARDRPAPSSQAVPHEGRRFSEARPQVPLQHYGNMSLPRGPVPGRSLLMGSLQVPGALNYCLLSAVAKPTCSRWALRPESHPGCNPIPWGLLSDSLDSKTQEGPLHPQPSRPLGEESSRAMTSGCPPGLKRTPFHKAPTEFPGTPTLEQHTLHLHQDPPVPRPGHNEGTSFSPEGAAHWRGRAPAGQGDKDAASLPCLLNMGQGY
nr:uncharacterized protein LOC111750189 [Loxodonta africana]